VSLFILGFLVCFMGFFLVPIWCFFHCMVWVCMLFRGGLVIMGFVIWGWFCLRCWVCFFCVFLFFFGLFGFCGGCLLFCVFLFVVWGFVVLVCFFVFLGWLPVCCLFYGLLCDFLHLVLDCVYGFLVVLFVGLLVVIVC